LSRTALIEMITCQFCDSTLWSVVAVFLYINTEQKVLVYSQPLFFNWSRSSKMRW